MRLITLLARLVVIGRVEAGDTRQPAIKAIPVSTDKVVFFNRVLYFVSKHKSPLPLPQLMTPAIAPIHHAIPVLTHLAPVLGFLGG